MNRLLVIASLALLTQAGIAQGKGKPLNDAALDGVTAGGITAGISNGVINFQGAVPTANGLVSSTGTLALQNGPLGGNTTNTLSLNGNAQQNLSSLININAVNSKINVLLNLNVNINSTVGTSGTTRLRLRLWCGSCIESMQGEYALEEGFRCSI